MYFLCALQPLRSEIINGLLKKAVAICLNELSLGVLSDVTLLGVVVADRHEDGDVGERRFAVACRRRQIDRELKNKKKCFSHKENNRK